MVYPEEFHAGLWGGEGVIKGLLKRPETRHRSFKPPPAKYFWPKLFEVNTSIKKNTLNLYLGIINILDCPCNFK